MDVVPVVCPLDQDAATFLVTEEAYTGHGKIINSDFLNGMNIEDAKEKVVSMLSEKQMGQKKVTYRLKDWGISRQRYWGCPIPVIHCEKCGVVAEKKRKSSGKTPRRHLF